MYIRHVTEWTTWTELNSELRVNEYANPRFRGQAATQLSGTKLEIPKVMSFVNKYYNAFAHITSSRYYVIYCVITLSTKKHKMQIATKTVDIDTAYLAIEYRALIGWIHLTNAYWSVRQKCQFSLVQFSSFHSMCTRLDCCVTRAGRPDGPACGGSLRQRQICWNFTQQPMHHRRKGTGLYPSVRLSRCLYLRRSHTLVCVFTGYWPMIKPLYRHTLWKICKEVVVECPTTP